MKSHRWWSYSVIALATMALASCTQGQIEQVLQNKTQDMISGPCPPGSGPVSAAPEFCLYMTELHVVNHDTEVDVSLTIANRTGRRLRLVLPFPTPNRPYLTDSSGTKWDMVANTGIPVRDNVSSLSLEPNVDSQVAFHFRRSGQGPADVTFSLRGEIEISKTDSRGELIPGYHPQAIRGFTFSGLRQAQQKSQAEPMQEKAPVAPAQPDAQITQTTAQALQASPQVSVPSLQATTPRAQVAAPRLESAPPITRGPETFVTNPEQVKRILAALDDSVWVADGSLSDTHVYVIYDTTCGFSKKLFMDTRALPNRPQFRWVTFKAKGKGAEMVVTKRTVEALRDAFAGKYAAPADAATASLAIEMNQTLDMILSFLPRRAYPTLIYKTAQGLTIFVGDPDNRQLQKLTSSVQSRPDRAGYQPASLGWLNKPAVITPAKRLHQYYNYSDASAPLYMAPYPNAPIVFEVAKDRGFPVDAVANDDWIRVEVAKMGKENVGLYGYIHAPLQIKLANLEFPVQRASGVVPTSNETEIRSHPTMEAPVIDKPGPGFQFQKTGEVVFEGRNWVEVIDKTDGTKGYIAQ